MQQLSDTDAEIIRAFEARHGRLSLCRIEHEMRRTGARTIAECYVKLEEERVKKNNEYLRNPKAF